MLHKKLLFRLLTPRLMIMLDESILTDIAAIPIISSGMFIRSEGRESDKFELNLTINKFQGELTKTSNYLWRSDSGEESTMSMVEIGSEIKFRSFSPDGSIYLVGLGKDSNDFKNCIEVWVDGGTRFLSCVNLSNVHGDFCIDGKLKILCNLKCTCTNEIYFFIFTSSFRGFQFF